jgi:Dyp-type peroxidase family
LRNVSQKGIVYYKNAKVGRSHSILFLTINSGITASEAGQALHKLWQMYLNLEKGLVIGLSQSEKNLYSGNLFTQIGYSYRVFDLPGVEKKMPAVLTKPWKFNDPHPEGGGPVIDGITLNYARNLKNNPVSADHILVQFTGDNEFVVMRPIVESWKMIQKEAIENEEVLRMDKFYTGFRRDDKRGWLGFHDGISTLKYADRTQAVFVNRSGLYNNDLWTIDGTYLSFLRIAIDVEEWESLDLQTQELIIGRKKLSGCPIVGINKRGEPLKDMRCPKPGTTEVIEKGNELFREQTYRSESQMYGNLNHKLESHVGKNLVESRTGFARPQHRIFRQSYHFMESSNDSPGFAVGLNFISYQNKPENFFRSLRYGFGVNSATRPITIPNLGNYLSVHAAGLFLLPPHNERENFPGSSIFYPEDAQYDVPVPGKRRRDRYHVQ